MASFLSAGIFTQEINASTVVPQVSTTVGAIAGVFAWGPAKKATLIDSENTLVKTFGKPSTFNAETWFTAANFLAYGNQLYVARAANTANVYNAIANTGAANVANHVVLNDDLFASAQSGFQANVLYIAKYLGDLGNSLKVAVCDTANQFSRSINLAADGANTLFAANTTLFSISVGSNTATVTLANTGVLGANTPLPYANAIYSALNIGDYITVGNSAIGTQDLKISSLGSILVQNTAGTNTGIASFTVNFSDVFKLSTNYTSNTVVRNWEFFKSVDRAPGTTPTVSAAGSSAIDGMHVVVVDEDGQFSGVSGTILEVFQQVSRATDAKNSDGSTNYVGNVINQGSSYIWYANDRASAASANSATVATSGATNPLSLSFTQGTNGSDETTVSLGTLASGYDLFKSKEDIDISLIMQGSARGGTGGEQLINYIIDNICTTRLDCIAFASPAKNTVVNNILNNPAQSVVAYYANVRDSTYAVLDSGYKYQYDRYNDVYRWIPLNGDIAGLCVYTDTVSDTWFSPAGFNRGTIKNCIKLAFNPNQSQRDLLYPNRINPVVTFKGQGTVLYGDKTATAIASAFDRINVRRLFILLEKSISKAAQSLLFEFNDEFTRANFKNLVEPDLRDIQGRRGIDQYKVICDLTNNTPQVIQSNQFVGDIYIRPAYSINFLRLNFIAVGQTVEFNNFVISQ